MNTTHDSTSTGEPHMGRRLMLRRAGVAAGTVVLAAVGVAEHARGGTEPPDAAHTAELLTGSWMIDRRDDATPPQARGVFSFTVGGVVIYHDIAPVGTTLTGTWAAAPDRASTATFWTGFDADPVAGTPSVTARVRANISVDGDRLSGTYDTTLYDAATDAELIVSTARSPVPESKCDCHEIDRMLEERPGPAE
jgi:hypothetical protein